MDDWNGISIKDFICPDDIQVFCSRTQSERTQPANSRGSIQKEDLGPAKDAHDRVVKRLDEEVVPVIKQMFKDVFPLFPADTVDWSPTVLLSYNTPAPNGASSIRGWHLDKGNKLYAGMIYLDDLDNAQDNPCLLINKTPNELGATTIAHGKNDLLAWPNATDTWHCVTDRPVSYRHRTMINFYATSPIWVHSYERVNGEDHTNPVKNFWINV